MAVSAMQARKPQTIRLLVVEDNEAYLYLIQKAFSSRDDVRWQLAIARDGEAAIQLLFEEEKADEPLPDLILLDWHLPKISGSALLRRIKEHEKLHRIPILVFSSSEAESDIHDA